MQFLAVFSIIIGLLSPSLAQANRKVVVVRDLQLAHCAEVVDEELVSATSRYRKAVGVLGSDLNGLHEETFNRSINKNRIFLDLHFGQSYPDQDKLLIASDSESSFFKTLAPLTQSANTTHWMHALYAQLVTRHQLRKLIAQVSFSGMQLEPSAVNALQEQLTKVEQDLDDSILSQQTLSPQENLSALKVYSAIDRLESLVAQALKLNLEFRMQVLDGLKNSFLSSTRSSSTPFVVLERQGAFGNRHSSFPDVQVSFLSAHTRHLIRSQAAFHQFDFSSAVEDLRITNWHEMETYLGSLWLGYKKAETETTTIRRLLMPPKAIQAARETQDEIPSRLQKALQVTKQFSPYLRYLETLTHPDSYVNGPSSDTAIDLQSDRVSLRRKIGFLLKQAQDSLSDLEASPQFTSPYIPGIDLYRSELHEATRKSYPALLNFVQDMAELDDEVKKLWAIELKFGDSLFTEWVKKL